MRGLRNFRWYFGDSDGLFRRQARAFFVVRQGVRGILGFARSLVLRGSLARRGDGERRRGNADLAVKQSFEKGHGGRNFCLILLLNMSKEAKWHG